MHVTPTNIEGRPALWLQQEEEAHVNTDYIVAFDWRDGRLKSIQDFRYAFY